MGQPDQEHGLLQPLVVHEPVSAPATDFGSPPRQGDQDQRRFRRQCNGRSAFSINLNARLTARARRPLPLCPCHDRAAAANALEQKIAAPEWQNQRDSCSLAAMRAGTNCHAIPQRPSSGSCNDAGDDEKNEHEADPCRGVPPAQALGCRRQFMSRLSCRQADGFGKILQCCAGSRLVERAFHQAMRSSVRRLDFKDLIEPAFNPAQCANLMKRNEDTPL